MDIMSLTVGFLVGTVTGAAGTYFGNKYTDVGKVKEEPEEELSFYEQLWDEHGPLLSEMKSDLTNPDFSYHREFFVLSNRFIFNHNGACLSYYIEEHDSLEEQLKAFESKGLIANVTAAGEEVTKYQHTDAFVEHLKRARTNE